MFSLAMPFFLSAENYCCYFIVLMTHLLGLQTVVATGELFAFERPEGKIKSKAPKS